MAGAEPEPGQEEEDVMQALLQRQKEIEAEMDMDQRTLGIFKAVMEQDVDVLRGLMKRGQDFALRNGAGETPIEMAQNRKLARVEKYLTATRDDLAEHATEHLQHSLRVAANADHMADFIKFAEESTVVSGDVIASAWRQHRRRRQEEVEGTKELARVMKTAKFAKEMSAAIEKAMDSGRCEFEQMRDAKAVLAKREVVEAAAHARLQTSLDYADSAGLAVALVKAEESGDIDDETLDAGWETQVLRVDNEEMTRALLADLAEEVMAAKPTHIRVWEIATAQIAEKHRIREETEAAEAARIRAMQEAAEAAELQRIADARKAFEDAIKAGEDATVLLFRAVVRDDPHEMEKLVLGGGDIHAVNRAGHTLWQLATERGSSKVLAWLQSHTRERVTAGDEVVQGSLLLHQLFFRVELFFERRLGSEEPPEEGEDEAPKMTAEEYFMSFDDDQSGGLDKEELREAVQTYLDAPEPEPEPRGDTEDNSGSDDDEGGGFSKYRKKFDRPETPDPRQVVSKLMPMTNVPIIASSRQLAEGPSPGARLLRDARRIFSKHQEDFGISLSLVFRNEHGAEWERPVLQRQRLPRFRQQELRRAATAAAAAAAAATAAAAAAASRDNNESDWYGANGANGQEEAGSEAEPEPEPEPEPVLHVIGAVPIPPPPPSKKKKAKAAKSAADDYISNLTGANVPRSSNSAASSSRPGTQGIGSAAASASAARSSVAGTASRPGTEGRGAPGSAATAAAAGGDDDDEHGAETEKGWNFLADGSSSEDEEEGDGARLLTPAQLTRMLEGQRIGTPEWHRLKAKAAAAERQAARALWVALARDPDAEGGSVWSFVLVERAPRQPGAGATAAAGGEEDYSFSNSAQWVRTKRAPHELAEALHSCFGHGRR